MLMHMDKENTGKPNYKKIDENQKGIGSCVSVEDGLFRVLLRDKCFELDSAQSN